MTSKRSVRSWLREMSHSGLELVILCTTVAGQSRKTKLSATYVSVWRSSGYWHSGIVSPSFVCLQIDSTMSALWWTGKLIHKWLRLWWINFVKICPQSRIILHIKQEHLESANSVNAVALSPCGDWIYVV